MEIYSYCDTIENRKKFRAKKARQEKIMKIIFVVLAAICVAFFILLIYLFNNTEYADFLEARYGK